MTLLLSVQSLSKSHGSQSLFKAISFPVTEKDRIGLLGPNGAGKSTLLRILIGEEKADSGDVIRRQGLRIGYAGQDPEFPDETIEHILTNQSLLGDEYEIATRARILLGKAQFTDFDQKASSLSGGWKKRLDIAKALMHQPDLLLLDEPTNHLDLEGIIWLEKFLLRENIPYIIVSHDRTFLETVSNKIMELNRCFPQGIFISEGNLSIFNERKEAFVEGQLQHQKGLASVVRDEIDWLRRSPKARTTKSRSRIQKAHELMADLAEIKQRNKVSKVDIGFSASERETKKLLVAKNLSKSIGDKKLFNKVDLTLSPGSRVGIVGKNGTGKTTLLKILAGTIAQDLGTIKYADQLKLVYFDQHREKLPPHITLKEALAPTSDMVNYRGQLIHVNGWAKKFLFSPDRLTLPVGCLSGGERARILIARLMLEPADILFLDEPTNDLDIPTLEVIEENLLEFNGAVVLISHDRCLMERLCTQILGLGMDREHEIYSTYSQWEAASSRIDPKREEKTKMSQEPQRTFKKLTYNEQRELEGMEKAILDAEQEISLFNEQLNGDVVHVDAHQSLSLYKSLDEAQKKLEALFVRWEHLSNKDKQ